jgi:hypothetical protein
VTIGSGEDPAPAESRAATSDANVATQNRIAALEARVAALETALAQLPTSEPGATPILPMRKLQWVAASSERAQDFSEEQATALVHNLGSVKSQEITIRTPAGDRIASEHALWFKSAFERAGWTVRGPEEIEPHSAGMTLALAVPELPVAQEAAATYLALKAAGFEPVPTLDPMPRTGKESSAIALTLPHARAA